MVSRLALSDIVPADYIKALPHSASSIQWQGDPRFSSDGQKVIIPVMIPSEDFVSEPATIDIAVDLLDGRVPPSSPAAWDAAQATGRKVLSVQVAYETATKEAFIAPLLGPKVNAERKWHDYLREAVGRLIGDDEMTSTTVLRLPGADDYAVSETWVHDALTESYADNVALASLSAPSLVAVLKRVTSKLPDRSYRRLRRLLRFPTRTGQKSWQRCAAAAQRSSSSTQLRPYLGVLSAYFGDTVMAAPRLA
ncbi:MAG: hypothetical protein ACKVOL_07560 [Novosphingobium sp.]